jgi:hypothetical protein
LEVESDVGADCEGKTAVGGVVTDAMGVLEIALRVDTRVAGGSDAIASKNDFFFFFLHRTLLWFVDMSIR